MSKQAVTALLTLLVSSAASAAAPTTTTSAASLVAARSAQLNGRVNPNGEATTGWFRHSTTAITTCDDSFGTRVPFAGGTGVGSGVTAMDYSVSTTGLSPGTQYWFCAISSNPSGTTFGAVLTFTTPSLAPTTDTISATNVTSSGATLNGEVIANGAATTAFFRYSTSNPFSCNASFGLRAPLTGGAMVSGNTNTPFAEVLTGLLAGTTYYYCAIATNSQGTTFGPVLSFTTLVAVPAVTTNAASSVNGTSAQLNGAANPNGSPTTGWFRYSPSDPGTCNDAFGTRVTAAGAPLGSGSTSQSYNLPVSGLTPGTRYWFCAIAQNGVGISFGAVRTFDTPAPPTMTTLAATTVAATSAVLNGTVNPNGSSTFSYYRYSPSNPGTCNDSFGPASAQASPGAGNTAVTMPITVSGLLPGTLYYYCAIGQNGVGIGFGTVLTFTTPPLAPTLTTNSASLVTGTTAQLNGTVNPRGDATVAWFRYSTTSPGTCNDTFGTRAPATGGTAVTAGNSGVSYLENVVGLAPGTTYYYCAIASNSVGPGVAGNIASFTTPNIPTVTTFVQSSLTGVSATLNGQANPNGATASAYFRYGTTNPGSCNDTFGTRLPATGGTSISFTQSYAFNATGLMPGTTYFFCALATNSVGTGLGNVLSFTTPALPSMTTLAVTTLAPTSVTLNGSANPNGAGTTAYFRISSVDPGTCNDSFGPATTTTSLFGNTVQAYSSFYSSLTPGTTYYYCAIGNNVVGTSFGAVMSFTTPAQIPLVSTNGVGSVTGTTATFNGTASSRGDASVAFFRYATTNPGTCNDTFGTRVPATGGTMLGAQASSSSFDEDVTGLNPGTTYFVCAMATNGVGTGFGGVTSFTTPAIPTVTTNPTSVFSNGTQAQLNGSLNSNGSVATAYFRYGTTDPGACNDTFGTRFPSTGGQSVNNSTFFQTLSGLTPGTTYYVCALGTNIVGTGFGAVLTFQTPAIPTVTTLAATGISATGALLNGSALPNGAGVTNATGYFRYSTSNPITCNDTFGIRAPSTGGTNLSSGSAAVPFSVNPATLLPGNTYYYCAIASNGVGTGFGAVLSFTTPALAPSVVTSTVTGVSSSGATLRGSTNPNGAATTAWFRYSTTNPGTCDDTFGTRAPASGDAMIPAGNSSVAHSEVLTGLSLATTYYYCAIAQNSVGLSFGGVVAFTTSPTAPGVTTLAATSITTTSGTMNATAVPNGSPSTGWFRYSPTMPASCNDSFGTRVPSSGGTTLGNGLSSVPYSVTPMTLASGVTYYYCAIASNAVDTSFGAVLSFKTVSTAPTLNTLSASGVGGTTATLNGTANPNGDDTVAWYRYSTTNPASCNDSFGTRVPATGGVMLGSGTTSTPFPQTLTGLTPGQTYYFCAIAQNAAGTTLGLVLSFSTPNAPAVTTTAATPVTATTATLNANAVPNGTSATGWFRFSPTDPGTCDDVFGTRYPAVSGGTPLGSGAMPVAYQQPLSGLTPGTQYFYCAIASNSVGTSFGALLSFFTPPAAPAVTTVPPTLVTATGASLNGTVIPNGAATTAWVRYSTSSPGTCNDSFGTRAPSTSGTMLGGGTTSTPFGQVVTGLSSGVTYYYCAIAQNAVGTTFGGIQQFTTPGAPIVTTGGVTLLTTTTATLGGSANPNRDAATGWFRYDTTNPGACNDTFGTRAPATGGTSLGGGSSGVSFTQGITGLSPGTTYWFCAIASNGVATSFGNPVSFVTPITPTVVTQAPSVLGSTTATLSATANPNGAATTGWFRYYTTSPASCVDSGGVRAPSTSGNPVGMGTAPITYTQPISGLFAATNYWVCAFALNSSGTGAGLPVQFTTTALPLVTSLAPSMVTTTSATLNAEANPRGAATTAWFRYSSTFTSSCNDTFGIRAPGTSGTMLGNGQMPAPFSQGISGLAQGTTYYWCAIAQNAVGTAFGTVQSFTTPSAPVVSSAAASGLGSTTATLNGSANPRSDATTAWFRWSTVSPGTCNDTFGTRTPATGGTSLGMGSTSVTFNEPLTGLTPGTTYFYCAIAQNSVGTSYGTVVSFVTPSQPTITTNAASSITASSALLSGTGVANNAAATGWFRISATDPGTCNDTFGNRFPATGGSSLGSSISSITYTQTATGLTGSTTYYFCAIASNVAGTSFGTVRSFTTPAAPTVTALAATNVTGSGATLNATANPNGSLSTGWFRYYTAMPATCSDVGGTRTPSTGGTSLGSGNTAAPYTATVTGLFSGTTYWFCAIASNALGTSFGAPTSFTTSGAPLVTTTAATSVTSSGASLNGSGTPRGADTTGYFRYSTTNPVSCTSTFGFRLPATGGTMLGTGSTAVPFTELLTGLAPATTYYYCAIAQSSLGTALGTVQSFTTTAGPAVTTSAATGVTSTAATLNGSANPRSSAATGWFRYAPSNPGSCDDAFGVRAPATGGTSLGSGAAAVTYTELLSGLTPGTTYWYCAVAQNGVGTSFGALLTFVTPGPPTATTFAASSVTSSSATLNGSGVPNGAATTGWLRYATTNPGTCNDTFGLRAPATGGTSLGSGTTAQSFSQPVTGLLQGTTYFFCAVAQSSLGTAFGTVLSFTTPSAPTVVTSAATSVTSIGATLNGSANPNGLSSTGWFRYSATNPATCSDTFGTRTPATGGVTLGAGSAAQSFSQGITGLSPGTTYWFCAVSQNSVGTAFGALLSFTAPAAAPVVTTNAASMVTGTGAVLSGSANPGGDATTGWFRYATTNPGTCNDTFGTREPLGTGGAALGAGTATQSWTRMLSGLAMGTTYYFCAIAQSSVGTGFGTVQQFTIPRPPTVVTQAPSGITSTGATLNGSVNPNFAATTAWFRYGTTNPTTCNDTFGTRTPATGGTLVGSGGAPSMISQTASGLTAGTTYFVCAIASNAAGTAFGTVQTFRTPARPTVMTSSATAVSTMGAILNGTVNPNGAQTTAWFRYATSNPGTCTDSFGTRAPALGGMAVGSGTTDVGWSQSTLGLQPGITYFFCAIAQNSVGLGFGQVLSFRADAPPPVVSTQPATDLTGRGATLNGSVNPNGTASDGWFRFATTDPGTCNDTFGTRVPGVGGLDVGAGTAVVSFTLAVTDLKANTTYFYCALAANIGGASMGGVVSFKTPAAPPIVETVSAATEDDGSVTIAGAANPNGSAADAWFQYDTVNPTVCNATFGTKTPLEPIALGAGIEPMSFSKNVADVPPGTYFFCAAASNAAGTSFGEVKQFTIGKVGGGGCGCGTTSPAPLAALVLALLVVARLRRRRS